jgi:cell pole-organizing protein PopZ
VFEPIEPEEPAVAAAPAQNDIFTDKTRQSIDDAFAAIDEPDEEEAPAPVAPVRAPVADISGLSVEAVFERAVREAFEPVVKQWLGDNAPQIVDRMKPLIREWMDEHFPALLEGAVRDEVARVAKARGTKK